jgi:hypothetical protein
MSKNGVLVRQRRQVRKLVERVAGSFCYQGGWGGGGREDSQDGLKIPGMDICSVNRKSSLSSVAKSGRGPVTQGFASRVAFLWGTGERGGGGVSPGIQ